MPCMATASYISSNNLDMLMGYPTDFSNIIQLLNNHFINQTDIETTPISSDYAAPNTSTMKATISPNIHTTSTPQTIFTPTPTSSPTVMTPTPTPSKAGDIVYSNGTKVTSDGTIVYPNGTVVYTNLDVSKVYPGQITDAYVLSEAQKDEARKIAATSPLCAEYNTYPDDSWTCDWACHPADGHTVAVWKEIDDGSSLDITVDLNTQKVVSSYRTPSISEVTHSRMH